MKSEKKRIAQDEKVQWIQNRAKQREREREREKEGGNSECWGSKKSLKWN